MFCLSYIIKIHPSVAFCQISCLQCHDEMSVIYQFSVKTMVGYSLFSIVLYMGSCFVCYWVSNKEFLNLARKSPYSVFCVMFCRLFIVFESLLPLLIWKSCNLLSVKFSHSNLLRNHMAIGTKFGINVHYVVLYKVWVFGADRKFNINYNVFWLAYISKIFSEITEQIWLWYRRNVR